MGRFWKGIFCAALPVLLIACRNNPSPIVPGGIRIVKSGLNFPWEIVWGKDDHIWMTERGGNISRIDPATGTATFSFTIPDVESNGEGGLLGMAFFFQAEDSIRYYKVTGVQTCALPICPSHSCVRYNRSAHAIGSCANRACERPDRVRASVIADTGMRWTRAALPAFISCTARSNS